MIPNAPRCLCTHSGTHSLSFPSIIWNTVSFPPSSSPPSSPSPLCSPAPRADYAARHPYRRAYAHAWIMPSHTAQTSAGCSSVKIPEPAPLTKNQSEVSRSPGKAVMPESGVRASRATVVIGIEKRACKLEPHTVVAAALASPHHLRHAVKVAMVYPPVGSGAGLRSCVPAWAGGIHE